MIIFLKFFVYSVATVAVAHSDASLRVQAYKKTLIAPTRQERSLPDVELPLNRTAEQRLPKALLIGVRKCGTRALLEFLNLHPMIAAASDELHFFDNDTNFETGVEAYRRQMPFTFDDQITIEKTPAYFSRQTVPARVKMMVGDDVAKMKFIVVFRDPVTRTISDYTQVLSNRKIRNITFPPFEQIAFRKKRSVPEIKVDRLPEVNRRYKAINISTYAYHMTNWLRYFPLEQFHFVDGDRLVTDPIVELRQVEQFLGLPHSIGSDLLYYNKTRGFYCMKVPHLAGEENNETLTEEDVVKRSSSVSLSTVMDQHSDSESFMFKNKCLRPDKGRQHPVISDPFIRQLRRYFRPLNELLFQIIQKRFDNWQ